MPSFTQSLEACIHQALAIANSERHEFATLEHFLLALTGEPDAFRVLDACSVDVLELQGQLIKFISEDLAGLVTDVEGSEAVPTASFQRVVQRAAIHVQSSARTEVTGANVLIAIFAERESNAAYFLQEQDMTRYDAVNFVSHGVAKKPTDLSSTSQTLFEVQERLKKIADVVQASETRAEVETVERRKIVTTLMRNGEDLALMAHAIQMQIADEIERAKSNKPNFSTDADREIYDRNLDFLELLADALDALAEGIAALGKSPAPEEVEALAESTQSLRDKILCYLRENRTDALFYGVRMPAMLGSIALFSLAGASMTTATPALMAIFGGDRIVRMIYQKKS